MALNFTTPSTVLDAVNVLLGAIGEQPVSALGAQVAADVALAQSVLTEVSREVQSAGWAWNTDRKYKLLPEATTGKIQLPSNCVLWTTDPDEHGYPTTIFQRGGYLYDTAEHTDVFTSGVYGNMVVLLDFTDIPEAARGYIVARASRVFQTKAVGSAELNSFLEKSEGIALAALRRFERKSQDLNFLNDKGRRTTRVGTGSILRRPR